MDPEARYNYLLSLQSVRGGAERVFEQAQLNKLQSFDFHPDRLDETAELICSIITRDFSPENFSQIPPHGRWQHFEIGSVPRLAGLLRQWRGVGLDDLECSRRMVDLFLVSVLLDAGAGDIWKFTEPGTGLQFERSEGLAVASLYAFTDRLFTKDGTQVEVNALGLKGLTADRLGNAMQSTTKNPLLGLQGRAELLQRLGDSLLSYPEIFGSTGRPGNMVDHLMLSRNQENMIDLDILWNLLQRLLIPTWPSSRTVYNGKPLGDAWPLHMLQETGNPPRLAIQPFHKLTQWLTYSLLVVFERLLGIKWRGTEHLTGLPEYRNGGLFVDMGVLTLKLEALKLDKASGSTLPVFEAGDDVTVEWRALTISLLDLMLEMVNQKLLASSKGTSSLSLAQLLEAGTWKAGRELAARHRPQTKSSPIIINSDGTLF